MAMENLNNILESIQNVFKSRDSKEKELQHQKESLEMSIDTIRMEIDSLSYKALIEEDKEAIKEHEALKIELDNKLEELELTKAKIKALGKFEVSRDTRAKAAELYKVTQKEIDKKSKELGKFTTDYYKAKVELLKAAKGIIELHKEINLLPLEIKEVLDLIVPEDIGKTEEEIREYRENLRDPRYYLDLFEDNRLKYIDNKLPREDINQILNGNININPYSNK